MSGSQVRSITREQADGDRRRACSRRSASASDRRRRAARRVPMRRLREAARRRRRQGFSVGPGGGRPHAAGAPVRSRAPARIGADVPLLIGSTETEATWNESQIYDPLDRCGAARGRGAGAAQRRRRRRPRDCRLPRAGRPKASNLDLYLDHRHRRARTSAPAPTRRPSARRRSGARRCSSTTSSGTRRCAAARCAPCTRWTSRSCSRTTRWPRRKWGRAPS